MIRDLEVLLLTITNLQSRRYVQEAVICYHAGAYRAAVVLAVAAGMDELRRKLDDLVTSGGANKQIQDEAKAIEKLFTDQQAFESQLITACENPVGFLTPSEAKKLHLLLKLRHLCAHPSGHNGSAEEAREAVASIVDLIFGRPMFLGMTAVADIVGRLSDPHLFPNDLTEKIVEVAKHEIRVIHQNLHAALVSKVIAEAIDTNTSPQARKNAARLLIGFALCGGTLRDFVWRHVEKIAGANLSYALAVVAADPEGIELARGIVRERIVLIIRRNLSSEIARKAARSLHRAGKLSLVERKEIAAAVPAADAAQLIRVADELLIPEVDDAVVRQIVDMCGGAAFTSANAAIDVVQGLDDERAERLFSSERKVTYLASVASSAGRAYPAFSARDVVKKGLGDRTSFIDALLVTARDSAEVLRSVETDWSKLAEMCENSARVDALLPLIELFSSAPEPDDSAFFMMAHLRKHKDARIAQAADAEHKRIRGSEE